jgi:outer membrane protein assembly factor BamB
MAIRAGGRGDITSTHVAWRLDRAAPFMSSPIVVGNYLFTVRSGGVMACIDARTGQLAWQERLPGAPGDYYASPVAIDGRLYVMNEEGQVSVVTATPRFEWLGSSDMAQRTLASPAVSQGALFIRTDTHLWAIGRRGR